MPAYTVQPDDRYPALSTYVTTDHAGAQSDTVLVAAPSAQNRIILIRLVIANRGTAQDDLVVETTADGLISAPSLGARARIAWEVGTLLLPNGVGIKLNSSQSAFTGVRYAIG